MGIGLLLSGISGAGKAVADIGENDQKIADDAKVMAARAKMEEQKMLRIDEVRRQRDNQERVDKAADIESGVVALRDERKATGLLDSNPDQDLRDRATVAQGKGYLDVSKDARAELRDNETVRDNKERNKQNDRRLDQQEARQSSMDEYNRNREERLDRMAAAQLSFQKARAGKEDARAEQAAIREQRSATQYALRSVQDDIKQMEKEASDPMLDPTRTMQIKADIATLRKEAGRYRSALADAGLEGSEAPAKAFDPSDFPVGGAKPSGGSSAPAARPQAQDSSSPQPAQTVDGRVLKTKEQLAEEDARREAFKRVSGGNSRRESAIGQRQNEVAQEFSNNLGMIKRGATRAEIGSALDWIAAHEDQLTNAQLKQVREARRGAGL